MTLSRRDFLLGCTACALALPGGGCAAVNPVPLRELDERGKLPVAGLLEKPGDQIKVKIGNTPDLVLVWVGPKDFGAASIACTHRGSEVHLNAVDGTLDCPSHGSRFGLDGQVLQGPAKQPLVRWTARVDQGLLSLSRA